MTDQELLNRITINPNVMVGKPIIYGTRLTIEYILNFFATAPPVIPIVVSRVTKGISDDCNAFTVEGPMYFRVSRLEKAYAFHVSHDGSIWDLIRYFTLEDNRNAQMGFEAQSPTGNRCTASFGDIHFEEQLLTDIRSG